ncbi:MAG: tripartite tricarboxylate transporter substrate binding protein [Curvibacter sp.]
MTRPLLRAARLSLVLLTLAAPLAHAYPSKTITIVVPTAPGGGNDAMARVIAQKIAPLLGQAVVVENKAGANGAIASEHVARAAPDGHTVLFGYVATHAMNPALQKLRYDPVRDFEPVGLIGYSPTLMVVNPQLKGRDARGTLERLRGGSDKFSYASAGSGTAPHFAAELFKMSTGMQLLHVPYKGSAPAMSDTLAGHTQVMFPSLFSALPHVKAGKLHAVAVAGSRRSGSLPDVPTLKELGVQGVDVTQWYGLFLPARTPKPVVERLSALLREVLHDKETIARIEEQGADVQTSTPDELRTLVREDLARWRLVAQQAGITAD